MDEWIYDVDAAPTGVRLAVWYKSHPDKWFALTLNPNGWTEGIGQVWRVPDAWRSIATPDFRP